MPSEENLVAMLLGKREPKVRLPLIGDLQNTVRHFLRDVLPGALVDIELCEQRQRLIRSWSHWRPFSGISAGHRPADRASESLIRSMRPIREVGTSTFSSVRYSITSQARSELGLLAPVLLLDQLLDQLGPMGLHQTNSGIDYLLAAIGILQYFESGRRHHTGIRFTLV